MANHAASDVTSTMLADSIRKVALSYVVDSRNPESGQQAYRLRNGRLPESVVALETGLAKSLNSIIACRSDYILKVSAGQPDRRYLLIPYAMILRKAITRTPRAGVYIALLFSQDCSGLWLTLNQGFGQFESRFSLRTAREHLKLASSIIGESVPVPSGFVRQSADLGASTPYGRGYEQGAILSKRYNAIEMSVATADELVADIKALMELYERMPAYVLRDPAAVTLENRCDIDEEAYQQAANRPAKKRQEMKDEPRSLRGPAKSQRGVSVWTRNVNVAREALARADHRCEADCANERFLAANGKHTYSEAHHLIPIAQQSRFQVSLDVPANIVSLCPACHAKVHRAHKKVRSELIRQLFLAREARLLASGLHTTEAQLLGMYS